MRIVLFLLIFTLSSEAYGQSFQKGNFIPSFGIDVGAYQTVRKNKTDPTQSLDAKPGAVGSIVLTGLQYGLTDRIGIGSYLRINTYALEGDSVNSNNTDFTLAGHYHFLITNYFNIQLGVQVGYSRYHDEDLSSHDLSNANGRLFQLDLGANLMVGKRLGFNVHTAYNNLHYGHLKVLPKEGANSNVYSLRYNGANIGISMIYRI